MAFWWYDVINPQYRRYLEDDEMIDNLKRYLDKFGVNTRDNSDSYVFNHLMISALRDRLFNELVDVIFEYNPIVFPEKQIDIWDDNDEDLDYFGFHQCYVLKKILEQDTDFKYLYYSFVLNKSVFRNLYQLYMSRFGCSKDPKLVLFMNHLKRGSTFFEMMKHRLFK